MDQVFSCISRALNKFNCFTLSSLIKVVKEAFTKPTPNVEELDCVLDLQSFLKEQLPPDNEIVGITNPHWFLIKQDPHARGPVKAKIISQLYSDTVESPPCHLLKNIPETKPYIKGGRSIFYQCEATPAVCAKRYEQFEKHLEKVIDMHEFSSDVREEWDRLKVWLNDLQTSERRPYTGFWPTCKEDVSVFLDSVCRQTTTEPTPLQTRPADGFPSRLPDDVINTAIAAARLEDHLARNVDFEGLRLGGNSAEDGRRGRHRAIHDVKRGNLVVLDNSSADNGEEGLLGDWEKEVTVGIVRNRLREDDSTGVGPREVPAKLELIVCEPWMLSPDTGEATMPLWLHREVSEEDVATTWDHAKYMAWKPVEALPLLTVNTFYKDSFTIDRPITRDTNFMGTNVEAVVRLDKQKSNRKSKALLQNAVYNPNHVHYVFQLEAGDREEGALLCDEGIRRIDHSIQLAKLRNRLEADASDNE